MMKPIEATRRFTKIEFQADEDWQMYPPSVYTCPSCETEVGFTMSEGAFQHFINLSPIDAALFDAAVASESEEHDSFLDLYCPRCNVPVRVYYLAWAGGRYIHGFKLDVLLEGKGRNREQSSASDIIKAAPEE